MPGLNFLKKKKTREGQPDQQNAASSPTSPVTTTTSTGSSTTVPASSSLKSSESGASSQQQQPQPSNPGQAPVSSGGSGHHHHIGHNFLHHLHHHSSSSSPHAHSQQQSQPQQPQPQQQQQQPGQLSYTPALSSSAGVSSAATASATTTTASPATSPTTATTTPAISGNKDPQSLNSAINLGNPPQQHEGTSHAASPSSNLDTSPFNSAASLGPPIAPLPSASPGTDPNALYNQQQASRLAPPHPDAMDTDPPQTQQPSQTHGQQPQQSEPQQPQQQQHHDQLQQNQSQNQGQGQAGLAVQARITKGKYSLVDFEILRTLGTGSFGRVHLVQSKHNQRFYAIKVLKKAQVVKMKQVEHTNDERRMLSDVKHPFLITLWGTFQDWKNIYMVMDFVEGGELFSLLRKSGRFPNPVAKFYAAEVTLALEYLHSKNIIYRDLKPENLLLDRHGHLKITDFGFAKRVPDKTWTLCGTPDYLAPEVVSNKGYNKSVDWWSLGILIYEMLCGYTPFWDSGSPMRIYENILKGKVKYPAYIVPEAQNLLERLITADLTKRLGNLYGGSSDVKSHPWFAEVTWDRLARKDIDAPYTPPVKAGAGDASQFDKYPEEHERYGVPGGTDDYGHLFTEF